MENKKQHYTSVDESKELINAGVPANTADGWVNDMGCFETLKSQHSICESWTTGKLLEMLPPYIVANGDEYTLKYTKSYVMKDDGHPDIEECVSYNSKYATLPGDFIGYSNVVDKCTFLKCLIKLVCWVYNYGNIILVNKQETPDYVRISQ